LKVDANIDEKRVRPLKEINQLKTFKMMVAYSPERSVSAYKTVTLNMD